MWGKFRVKMAEVYRQLLHQCMQSSLGVRVSNRDEERVFCFDLTLFGAP